MQAKAHCDAALVYWPMPPMLRYFLLAAYWFGFSFHWFLLLPNLMPQDVVGFVGEADKAGYLGWLQGLGAVISLVLPPFLGMWSDRLGKRLNFLLYGTVVNVVGLVAMMLAPNYGLYFVAYCLVQLGNAVASSPYTALVPDVVPKAEHGTASAALGFFEVLSWILGGVAAVVVSGNRDTLYLAIIITLVVTTLITYFSTKEPVKASKSSEVPDWKALMLAPYRDFRWITLTRTIVEFGRFAVQPFLLFYLADVVKNFELFGQDFKNAGTAQTILFVALAVAAAATTLIAGPLSDKYGKKPVVYVAGAGMAVAALGFAVVNTYPLAVLMGMLFGLGFGAYKSADWALATSSLPNEHTYARDMGVWHIALVFPQLFTGFLGQLLDAGNKASPNGGYPLLFGVAVVCFALGTVFVYQVRNSK
jgi:MFS family permease